MRRTSVGWVGIVGALVLASFSWTVGPAAAQLSPPSQQVPSSTWLQPGTGNLDGLGGFVYIAPPAPGATQGSPQGYEFNLSFRLEDNSLGIMVLGHKDGQRVAGFGIVPHTLTTVAPAPFQWNYGQIYYFLTYRLSATQWGGWIYDWSAASWSLIGVLTVPGTTGRMLPTATTSVDYQGNPPPMPNANTSTCAFYPRIDAFFYAPMGWRGETITNAALQGNSTAAGACPATISTEHGWQRYTLGAAA
jgi:hypothetical protein